MKPIDINSQYPHQPVLYQEILYALRPRPGEHYVDATVGAGGHAWGILNISGPNSSLLGLDVDPQALAIAGQRLSGFQKRCTLVQASYTTLLNQLQKLSWQEVDGIVIDLGVSSMQIDTPQRGFSFRADGPLDMRFNPTSGPTAGDLVNTLPEAELADLIWRYGEEKQSRRIAKAICSARPLETTSQLAEVIRGAIKGKYGRIDPATRTFQALRIVVNEELRAVETFLPQAVSALKPGGHLAVIAFHSLEDRIVKQYFRQESRDCICPPEQPVCNCEHKAILKEVNRRPIMAEETEIENNPRARSARLRIVEKL